MTWQDLQVTSKKQAIRFASLLTKIDRWPTAKAEEMVDKIVRAGVSLTNYDAREKKARELIRNITEMRATLLEHLENVQFITPSPAPVRTCGCGCGVVLKENVKYIPGHQNMEKPGWRSEYTLLKFVTP